jgi:hypothetical protein
LRVVEVTHVVEDDLGAEHAGQSLHLHDRNRIRRQSATKPFQLRM